MSMRQNHAPLFYVVLAVLLIAGSAAAFPKMFWWHSDSDNNPDAGGGGIYATGAQQDFGIKCSNCHIDGEGRIDARFDLSPNFQEVGGELAYAPGQRYQVTVSMLGEHLGLDTPNDNGNGMNVVMEDASGRRAGEYVTDSGVDSMSCPTMAPPDADASLATTYVYGDCHGVLAVGLHDRTVWTFDWIAPSAGTGEVTLFYGMVDGD
jgi:hypothetical protein